MRVFLSLVTVATVCASNTMAKPVWFLKEATSAQLESHLYGKWKFTTSRCSSGKAMNEKKGMGILSINETSTRLEMTEKDSLADSVAKPIWNGPSGIRGHVLQVNQLQPNGSYDFTSHLFDIKGNVLEILMLQRGLSECADKDLEVMVFKKIQDTLDGSERKLTFNCPATQEGLPFVTLSIYDGNPSVFNADLAPDNADEPLPHTWLLSGSKPWLSCKYGKENKAHYVKDIAKPVRQCETIKSKKESQVYDSIECIQHEVTH